MYEKSEIMKSIIGENNNLINDIHSTANYETNHDTNFDNLVSDSFIFILIHDI